MSIKKNHFTRHYETWSNWIFELFVTLLGQSFCGFWIKNKIELKGNLNPSRMELFERFAA